MFKSFKIILQFFKGMFLNLPVRIKGKTFPLIKIKGLRAFKLGNLLFIEQNPDKNSRWSKMAKAGAKILWVIDKKRNKYLFQVINNKVIKL